MPASSTTLRPASGAVRWNGARPGGSGSARAGRRRPAGPPAASGTSRPELGLQAPLEGGSSSLAPLEALRVEQLDAVVRPGVVARGDDDAGGGAELRGRGRRRRESGSRPRSCTSSAARLSARRPASGRSSGVLSRVSPPSTTRGESAVVPWRSRSVAARCDGEGGHGGAVERGLAEAAADAVGAEEAAGSLSSRFFLSLVRLPRTVVVAAAAMGMRTVTRVGSHDLDQRVGRGPPAPRPRT